MKKINYFLKYIMYLLKLNSLSISCKNMFNVIKTLVDFLRKNPRVFAL